MGKFLSMRMTQLNLNIRIINKRVLGRRNVQVNSEWRDEEEISSLKQWSNKGE